MQPTGIGILSLLTFLPLVGAILLMLMPEQFGKAIKGVALATTVVTFVVSLVMYFQFQGSTYHFQMLEYIPWLPKAGISYLLGVDGISIWLVLLTTFLMVISTWFSFYVQNRIKAYMVSMLVLETAMLGVFLSLDLVLFFTFFELTLIPMYLLISIWGGANRAYAAVKFFIYTAAGSIFLLIGIIALALLYRNANGQISFNLIEIQSSVAAGTLWANALQAQALLFWAFAVALLIKCPMFPFHTWLPDAHVEAPTAGSIILAGVLLKMGTYGFLRLLLPLFPDVLPTYIPILMGLSVFGILYGAIVAAVQPDVKKLVAYSSVAHMGFVTLGIFSLSHTGLMGGSFQQLAHGISTGGLFLLIGLLYERRHTRLFKDFGGLKAQMPLYSALFLIIMLSSVGLPTTNGFIGEFLAMLGAFQAAYYGVFGLNVWFAVIAGTGVILAAVYLLVMFMKVFYGPNDNPENQRLKDIKPWEFGMVGLLIVFVFWGGLYPNTFLKPTEASIGAVRMMAIKPVGERPTWSDLELEIDKQGNLVRVQDRERNGDLENYQVISQVSAADFDFAELRQAATAGEPAEEVAMGDSH